MTPEEISRRDLRWVCYHECGHAVAAFHFGIATRIEVWRSSVSNPFEFKMWGGRCRLMSDPGEHRATISLAGELAALLADDGDLTADLAWEILSMDANALSETDRETAGAFTERDVESCLELVRELWPEIEAMAKFQGDKALFSTELSKAAE